MNTPTLAVGVLALVLGYVAGRARPWLALGDWAIDQPRFGDAARGGRARQAAVFVAHSVTHPVTTWRIWRAGPPAPVFVSRWNTPGSSADETGKAEA